MSRNRDKNSNTAKRSEHPLRFVHLAGIVFAALLVSGIALVQYSFATYKGKGQAWVHIPAGASTQAVGDSLRSAFGDDFGSRVYYLWQIAGGKPETARGAYRIDGSTRVWRAAHSIMNGAQTPIRVTFNNVRTLQELATRLSSDMDWTAQDFLTACDTVLPQSGFSKQQFPAAFLPDSYEFYWTTPADKVVKRLLDYRNRFWNDDRRAKARSLSLTPVQVATIASIIEEETAKSDERPKVARLYLNRLEKGMKLQADPTVKFAVGDFSLRRIKGAHLAVKSPYNTYLCYGLPPGPIRVASKAAIEAVLSAPRHNYIYMCAKEDFSGYHNFAVDFATHQANARRYREMLNRRKIN